ncbi:MAG: hypothetical protein JO076_08220 [Verrucomicrobia bacterium]|nr:hypothetical protein [Verrucomicrobiota bacterium]
MTAMESLARLRDSGFEQGQAEAILAVIESSEYVTKVDLDSAVTRLENRLETKVAQLETKISEAKNAIWLPFFLLLAAQVATHFWK